MGHLAVCEDSPNFDPVVMVGGILAADSKKFVVRRLHVSRFVQAGDSRDTHAILSQF